MRYRLPEVLGGGECTVVERDPALTLMGKPAHVVMTEDGTYVVVQTGTLTVVMPEEPPNLTVLRAGTAVYQRDDGLGRDVGSTRSWWWMAGRAQSTDWPSIARLEFVRLVPDPFAEPVELPWGGSHGLKVSQTHTDSGPGDKVYVSTKGASYGFAHVKPSLAREMARALWAAADAAEKEQS